MRNRGVITTWAQVKMVHLYTYTHVPSRRAYEFFDYEICFVVDNGFLILDIGLVDETAFTGPLDGSASEMENGKTCISTDTGMQSRKIGCERAPVADHR